MRDTYTEEADAVARKYNLRHELIDELEIRGLIVRQFQWIDDNDRVNDLGVKLVDRKGNVVARKNMDHVARATIAALDEILGNERAANN
jgi:hypothetical protein